MMVEAQEQRQARNEEHIEFQETKKTLEQRQRLQDLIKTWNTTKSNISKT